MGPEAKRKRKGQSRFDAPKAPQAPPATIPFILDKGPIQSLSPVREFGCIDDDLLVLVVYPGERLCFHGAFSICCIGGDVLVNGFELKEHSFERENMLRVCAPERYHIPAIIEVKVFPGNAQSYKHTRLKYRLKEITSSFEEIMNFIGNGCPSVIIIDKKVGKVEAISDSLFENFLVHRKWQNEGIYQSRIHYQRMDYFLYSKECENQLQSNLNDLNSARKDGQKVAVISVGSKGAGKSTFTRYFVNRALNGDNPPVYFLDCDIGQTEFTPPGCMSLWKITEPMLGVPFSHQKADFSNAFFFGGISPGDEVEKYMATFERLWNAFLNISEPGSLVVINTMGWIEGIGREILFRIYELVRPCLSINLRSMDGAPDFVPRRGTLRVHLVLQPNEWVVDRSVPTQAKINAAERRDLNIIGYFSSLCPRSTLSSLIEHPPYRISFKNATLCLPEDLSLVDDKFLLATFNAQPIALCVDSQPTEYRRLLNHKLMPRIAVMSARDAALKCIGFGLIRAISLEHREIYVSTPVDLKSLTDIPIFARGTGIYTPRHIFASQPNQTVPYLARVDPQRANSDGLLENLHQELVNTTRHKRGRR